MRHGIPNYNATASASRGLDQTAIEAVLGHVPKEEPDNIIVRKDSTTGFGSARESPCGLEGPA